ncbi:MAG: hypothetical protein FJ304_20840 [Planctomycetes bacterium]|nr:hypothetical protein [Planctomycetota bacterium]
MSKRRRSITHKAIAAARRERAIGALLSCLTIAAAATAAGLGESTLRKWLRQPKFAAAYKAAREAMLNQVVGAMVSATSDALATLKRNLTCGQPGPEVRAAVALVELTLRGEEHLLALGELSELREQVAALMEQAKQQEGQG